MGPVVPAPAHREEALVPDDLADDLEADARQARCHLGGMDAGVPDVADVERGHEREGVGPVDAGVAREGRVAVALRPSTRALVLAVLDAACTASRRDRARCGRRRARSGRASRRRAGRWPGAGAWHRRAAGPPPRGRWRRRRGGGARPAARGHRASCVARVAPFRGLTPARTTRVGRPAPWHRGFVEILYLVVAEARQRDVQLDAPPDACPGPFSGPSPRMPSGCLAERRAV